MKKVGIIFYFLVGIINFSIADTLSDAEALFKAGNYNAAKPKYAALLKVKPKDIDLNYKYGVCLLKLGEPEPAIKALDLAAKKMPQANITLADYFYLKYNFSQAITYYEQALSLIPATSAADYANTTLWLDKANRAQNMLQSVEDIQMIDSAVVAKNIFLSFYKISSDAGRIFKVDENDHSSEFPLTGFMTERQDRSLFSEKINGQTDIYTTSKLLDGWTDKQSLQGAVNTGNNENFPFLLPDGITLYFASNGLNSIGGYDIFVSRYRSETNSFLQPMNIGMPFNSPANDYMFAIDEEQGVGYFATDRNQPAGKVIVYKFKPNSTKKIVATDNEDEKIAAAQLKKYSIYIPPKIKEDNNGLPATKPVEAQGMNFVITDNLIYDSTDQFVSQEARNAYTKAIELEQKQKTLNEKRAQYATAGEEARAELATEITNLEQELKGNTNDYFKQARNLEIEALQNQKLP